MKQLGKKLEAELPEDAIIVSNVFAFPGWKAIQTSAERTHIYIVPKRKETS